MSFLFSCFQHISSPYLLYHISMKKAKHLCLTFFDRLRQSGGSAFLYMFYFLPFLPFLQLLQLLQPLHAEQSPEQPPPFLTRYMITSARAITISASRIMLGIFISSIISPYAMPKIIPTQRTRSAIIHAIAHCINTVTVAERTLPSSRFTVAIAATHGV